MRTPEREERRDDEGRIFRPKHGLCHMRPGIEKRLKKLDGVQSVKAAIMLNKIFVDYDESKVGIYEIKNAIKEAGYSNYLTEGMVDNP